MYSKIYAVTLITGKCAIIIFLGFLKASDTFDHGILLANLYNYENMGIALDRISSYNFNR